jgi:hypothetical protein
MSRNNHLQSELTAKVYVESFPSRVELFYLLDNFLEQKGIAKDYMSDNKDNMIIFKFNNPVQK